MSLWYSAIRSQRWKMENFHLPSASYLLEKLLTNDFICYCFLITIQHIFIKPTYYINIYMRITSLKYETASCSFLKITVTRYVQQEQRPRPYWNTSSLNTAYMNYYSVCSLFFILCRVHEEWQNIRTSCTSLSVPESAICRQHSWFAEAQGFQNVG